ncbi:MAG: hypothetical protein LBG13_02600 [Holosporales bacterium]|jgi:hypothetical protein|nr:hypothetical protein [Holosporales bacterium]
MTISRTIQYLLLALFIAATYSSLCVCDLNARAENKNTKREQRSIKKKKEEEEKKDNGNEKIDPALAEFEKETTKGINLEGQNLNEIDMKYLVDWLTKNNDKYSKIELGLSGCQLNEETLNILFKFISENPQVITMLIIRNNGRVSVIDAMYDFVKDESGNISGEKVFRLLIGIILIDLSDSNIGDSEAKKLAEILKTTSGTPNISIVLSKNKITTPNPFVSAEGNINEINLEGNPIPETQKNNKELPPSFKFDEAPASEDSTISAAPLSTTSPLIIDE